jgi:hypothetical protein
MLTIGTKIFQFQAVINKYMVDVHTSAMEAAMMSCKLQSSWCLQVNVTRNG